MISVLICTYNKSKFLDITLAGYQNQSCKDFELVIIDDGSTDETSSVIKKYQDKINIKYCPQERKGISKARSATLEQATNDYVIISDDDRIPSRNFILEHKKRLESGEKAVYIGKQGLVLSQFNRDIKFKFKDEFKLYNKFPELLNGEEKQLFTADDVIRDWEGVLDNYFLSYYTESYLLEIVKEYGEDLEDFYLGWTRAYGGNMSFNRNYCTEPLIYDNNYKGYGIEDVDFSYQLFKQGFKFRFSSAAINYHQEHRRNKDENRQMYQNWQYFCNKYPDLIVKIAKMDWDDKITIEEGNDFYRMLLKQKDLVKDDVLKFLNR